MSQLFHALRHYAISTTTEQDLMRGPKFSAGAGIYTSLAIPVRAKTILLHINKRLAINRIVTHIWVVSIFQICVSHMANVSRQQ